MSERGITKTRTGFVRRKSSDKTIMVEVERMVMHEKFKKYIRKRKNFVVHDPKNQCTVGDLVSIVETRPISKMKRWKLKDIIQKGDAIIEAV
jgi:small subunit ribosomal protein S17